MFGGAGHQGRTVPVDSNLILVRERQPLAGQPAKISQVVLGRLLRRGLPGRYSESGSRNLTLWNLASEPVNQVNKVLVSEFG
jgi:hypothetical protein